MLILTCYNQFSSRAKDPVVPSSVSHSETEWYKNLSAAESVCWGEPVQIINQFHIPAPWCFSNVHINMTVSSSLSFLDPLAECLCGSLVQTFMFLRGWILLTLIRFNPVTSSDHIFILSIIINLMSVCCNVVLFLSEERVVILKPFK